MKIHRKIVVLVALSALALGCDGLADDEEATILAPLQKGEVPPCSDDAGAAPDGAPAPVDAGIEPDADVPLPVDGGIPDADVPFPVDASVPDATPWPVDASVPDETSDAGECNE